MDRDGVQQMGVGYIYVYESAYASKTVSVIEFDSVSVCYLLVGLNYTLSLLAHPFVFILLGNQKI